MPKGKQVGKGRAKAGAAKVAGSKPSRKTAKADQVEMSQGVQLLLANGPSDAKALEHYQVLASLKSKSKRAAKLVANQKATMKSMGFDVEAFETRQKMEKWDPMDLAAHFKELQRLMRLQGAPIQLELRETKYDSIEEQARAEGRQLGLAGKSPATDRYPEGSEGYEPHMKAWQAGQAELTAAGAKPAKKGETVKDGDGEGGDED